MKSKNNKGSAFVMVLVILAIVGVLAAVAMWVSLVNYQMKLTDVKVKNNFYSAESVLDQICVGLQGDVSEAYEGAYKRVLVDYMLLSDNERQTLFAKKYKDGIKKRLKMDSDADAMSYDIDKLRGYVWGGLQNSAKLPYAEIKVASGCEAANGIDGRMDTFESNIVLNGIEVTYTDEEGFTSIIQTNISIAVPEMKFSNADAMPDTFSYSLVGTEGISVNIPSTITGSVYAGVEDNEEVSLNLVGGVTFTNSQFLISTGTTKVGVGATLTVPRSAQLWTDNIVVDSGTQANLLGETSWQMI